MKTVLWIGLGMLVVMALVVAGLGAGWALWGRQLWAAGPALPRDPGPGWVETPGMMPGMRWSWGEGTRRWTEGPPRLDAEAASPAPEELSIEEAHEAAERYLRSRRYDQLEVAEVMAFEHNFYAIAREHDTGVGAMELLIDKETGTVGPEMGPNMMWNDRYGMHRGGRMGNSRRANTVGPDEAVDIAQQWLDANRPGRTADEHADPFYGYYTIHTLRDGDVEGMLSVHGASGQVWYHTWHGDFVQMIGEEEIH